ncbi:MAG: DUF4157 domain-containing protein [Proteobacteria bacterium]|nr:DUF4157 domain-containing protein [Pseudomonadota bacterium]
MKRSERPPEQAARHPAPKLRPTPAPASVFPNLASQLRNAQQGAGNAAVAEAALAAGREADEDADILPSRAARFEGARRLLERRPEAEAPSRPGPASAYDSIIAAANQLDSKAKTRRHADPEQSGSTPTISDVATKAIEAKGSGDSLDGAVANKVSAHLSADFSNVRVHTDRDSAAATAAMGARAFAHNKDIFLAPGESPTDVELMAHELTHVAQQGAANRAVQRRVEVGPENSPAEQQADQVARQVVSGAAPASLIVEGGRPEPRQARREASGGRAGQAGATSSREVSTRGPQRIVDDEVAPGAAQLTKSEFLGQLAAAIRDRGARELGSLTWGLAGESRLQRQMAEYSSYSATALESAIVQHAPECANEPTAQALIHKLVEVASADWSGEESAGDTTVDRGTGAATQTSPVQRKGSGSGTSPPTPKELTGGAPLDSRAASRIGDALGESFAAVQIYTGAGAAELARAHDAQALTYESHIAFAPGKYRPNTLEGDALLAHELAHVVQQRHRGGSIDRMGSGSSGAHEEEADQVAAGVVRRLYGGARAGVRSLAQRVRPVLTTAPQLQRCDHGLEDKVCPRRHRQLATLLTEDEAKVCELIVGHKKKKSAGPKDKKKKSAGPKDKKKKSAGLKDKEKKCTDLKDKEKKCTDLKDKTIKCPICSAIKSKQSAATEKQFNACVLKEYPDFTKKDTDCEGPGGGAAEDKDQGAQAQQCPWDAPAKDAAEDKDQGAQAQQCPWDAPAKDIDEAWK